MEQETTPQKVDAKPSDKPINPAELLKDLMGGAMNEVAVEAEKFTEFVKQALPDIYNEVRACKTEILRLRAEIEKLRREVRP